MAALVLLICAGCSSKSSPATTGSPAAAVSSEAPAASPPVTLSGKVTNKATKDLSTGAMSTTHELGRVVRILMRRSVRVVFVGAVCLVAVAAPAFAGNASVAIHDNFYQPKTVQIGLNDSVTWTDMGSAPHSVTSHSGQSESFDS